MVDGKLDEGTTVLPPEVLNLAQREREVAILVYSSGPMTAKEVEERLDRELSNSAIRAMLERLYRKKILTRRKLQGSHMPTDRRIPYVYTPAILADGVRKAVLRDIARNYFQGSLICAARTMIEVLSEDLNSCPARSKSERSRSKAISPVRLANADDNHPWSPASARSDRHLCPRTLRS